MIKKNLFILFVKISSIYFILSYFILIAALSGKNQSILIVRFISDFIHFGFFYTIALFLSRNFVQFIPYNFYVKFITLFLIIIPSIFIIRDYMDGLYIPANATLFIGVVPNIIGVFYFKREKL
ncbi:MAG: hypothetical protein Q4A62_03205 [Eikenella sp.]|nr:hypothetical protein [Eikenella sp.]